MSDVYIPGVQSRFNTDQLIENLMRVESAPLQRTEQNVNSLQAQRGYWQELGRRVTALRESARTLFSFQNPFNDRIASSADTSVLTASATREASEREYSFTVKQTAQADRFLSSPVDERMQVEAGTYNFNIGGEDISFAFRGGTLKDFVDALNRRGREKISASLIAVQSGTKSLLIESRVTGEGNRLSFSGDTPALLIRVGMMQQGNDTRRDIQLSENTVRRTGSSGSFGVTDGTLNVSALSSVSIPMGISVPSDSPVVLRFELSTKVNTGQITDVSLPPPGPNVLPGSASYGGITIENIPSAAPMPQWEPPAAPVRHDTMDVLVLAFSDGSTARLPAISDSSNFQTREYRLSDIAQGRTIVSLNIENGNTHREIAVRNVTVLDPQSISGGLIPLNPVSTARDAIISMEGIEMRRSSNSIDDIVPGLTLNIKGASDRPVQLTVAADIQAVKDSIISFVGNYNRLISEINVLTARSLPSSGYNTSVDDSIINELTYLTAEERTEMRKRLGAFNGDVTLNTLRNNLMRTVSAPYPTMLERDLILLSQIGISTNARGNSGGGYDPSRLRGYLEINERTLDSALETKLMAIKQIFGNDTTGDLINDTGVAVNIDMLVRPFVETGGIISIKTTTLDSRITQDQRRIATLQQQLAAKEQEYRMQFAQMENAYSRMEQMSNSLNNFSQQNSNGR
jgi:flagellar hook-associated protein 2